MATAPVVPAPPSASATFPVTLRLSDSARDDARLHQELAACLAEPRATAMVLVSLPVLGLALGTALGTDPLRWLTSGGLGTAVLVSGVALQALGAWWAWWIATRAVMDR